jgi:hypothetical protein
MIGWVEDVQGPQRHLRVIKGGRAWDGAQGGYEERMREGGDVEGTGWAGWMIGMSRQKVCVSERASD